MFNGRHQIDKEKVKKWLEEKRAEESETRLIYENGRWLTPFEAILEKIETQNETIKQLIEEVKELKATKNLITEYEPEKPTPTLLKRVETIEEKIKTDRDYIIVFKQDIDEIKKKLEAAENEMLMTKKEFEKKVEKDYIRGLMKECEKTEQEERAEENKKYIVHRDVGDTGDLQRYVVSIIGKTSTDRRRAKEFTQEEAIKIRNEKNKHFENCLCQWVISEVK